MKEHRETVVHIGLSREAVDVGCKSFPLAQYCNSVVEVFFARKVDGGKTQLHAQYCFGCGCAPQRCEQKLRHALLQNADQLRFAFPLSCANVAPLPLKPIALAMPAHNKNTLPHACPRLTQSNMGGMFEHRRATIDFTFSIQY